MPPITAGGNCPLPGGAKSNRRACHFWGEPHFTHVFQNKIEDELAKGARSSKYERGKSFKHLNAEFQGTGVYNFASSSEDEFSSQVYFCPAGNTGTSVGAAIAMRFGETTISIVRHPGTAGKGSGKEKYATLTGKSEDQFYTVRKSDGEGTTTMLVSSLDEMSKKYFAGNQVWMQKTSISDWHPHSKKGKKTVSNAAICAGNNPQSVLVDVSVPSFKLNVGWEIHFELAVTVVVQKDKYDNTGICGIEDFLDSGASGFEDARPTEGSELLFNEAELNTLHDLCGVSWTGSATTSATATAEQICQNHGRTDDFAHITNKCKERYADKPIWLHACQVEACAGFPTEWVKAVMDDEIDFDNQLVR